MSDPGMKKNPDNVEDAPTAARSRNTGRLLLVVAVVLGLGLGGVYLLIAQGMPGEVSSGDAPGDNAAGPTVAATGATAGERSPVKSDGDWPYPTNADQLRADVARVVNTLAARFPDSLDCLELQARLAEWMGRHDEARKLWEECLERDPQYPHALYGLAKLAARQGDLERAVELSRRALEREPGYFLARVVAAETLLRLNRPQEVVDLLKDQLATDPRSQGAYLLGQAYSQLSKFEEAVNAYRMAVELYPEHAEAYSAMVPALMRLGKKDEASEMLKRARQVRDKQAEERPSRKSTRQDLEVMFDNAARLYADAGRIYLAFGLRREAEEVLRRAAVASPRDAESRFALAGLYAQSHRLSEAVALLDQVAVAHQDSVEMLLRLAGAFAAIGAYDKAEAMLEQACELAPQRSDVWFMRAEYYVTRNRELEQAIEYARRSLQLRPSAQGYALLAAACDRAGKTEEAIKAIDRAVELAPDSEVYRRVQEELKSQAGSGNP